MSTPMDLNRERWDEATDIHARGNVYGIEDFKAGRYQLHRIEVEELGDVAGKTLLHLQCHFGLDTLSWAGRGAIVTGVDFSPKAIALARSLATEVRIDARFVESNLYDLPTTLSGRFDIVFASYGVLCWLPDLKRWGEIVARYLEPGGFFYIAEAHPFIRVFPTDEDITDGSTELRPYFSYFHDPAGTRWPPAADYADKASRYTTPEHTWQHSMGDIVNALVAAGLRIDFLHEFPYCVWKVIAFTEPVEPGCWGLGPRFPRLPLMFSLKATKPLS
jgi:SAM-dependent methyltransferase